MEHFYIDAALTKELQVWGSKSVAELVNRIGLTQKIRVIELAGGLVSLEVSVRWADATRERITVEAVANGPHPLNQTVRSISVPLEVDDAGKLVMPNTSLERTRDR